MNVASLAAYGPMAYTATYAATKAFVLSFSESVAAELAGTGVHIVCVCPGFTRTEFQESAEIDTSRLPGFVWMSSEAGGRPGGSRRRADERRRQRGDEQSHLRADEAGAPRGSSPVPAWCCGRSQRSASCWRGCWLRGCRMYRVPRSFVRPARLLGDRAARPGRGRRARP